MDKRKMPVLLSGGLTYNLSGIARSVLSRAKHLKEVYDYETVILVDTFHACAEKEEAKLRNAGLLHESTEIRNLFVSLRDLERRGEVESHNGIKFIPEVFDAVRDEENPNVVRYYDDGEYVAYANWGDGSYTPVVNLLVDGKRYKTIWLDEAGNVTFARIFDEENRVVSEEYFTTYGLRYLYSTFKNGKPDRYFVIDENMSERCFKSFEALLTYWFISMNEDILHSHVLISEWTFRKNAIEKAKETLGFKAVYVFHGTHILTTHPRYRDEIVPLYADTVSFIPQMDACVVLTNDQYFDLRKRDPKLTNVWTIPHVMEPIVEVESEVQRDPRLVVSVSQLRPVKGIAEFVSVFQRVIEKCPNLDPKFEIYGSGVEEPRIRQAIKENQLEDHVYLMGYTDDSTSVYKRASVAVYPSQREGQPLSLAEAIFSGCVPAAFDFKYGARSAIDNGVNGLIADLDNYEELADAVALLLSDQEMREKMSRECIDRRDAYTREEFADKWHRLLTSLGAY